MKRGFFTIMAAQFFSSLADNALLIAAIALLIEAHAPDWMKPLLKLFFTISYVLLAPFVGAFADSMPKGRVMFVTNTIKVVGCLLMFFTIHPLLAYAVVGFGAAAYSPAKYGILTELLPPEKLVEANGWIEGTTVGSIILGTVLGGALISPAVAGALLALDFPFVETGVDTPAEAAILIISLVYLIAAGFNLRIPDTGARYPHQVRNPIRLVVGVRALLHDALEGQARADLAGGDHALLGRRRDAAVHRARVGEDRAEAAAEQGRDPAGRGRARHRGRRRGCGPIHSAEAARCACSRWASRWACWSRS